MSASLVMRCCKVRVTVTCEVWVPGTDADILEEINDRITPASLNLYGMDEVHAVADAELVAVLEVQA